LLEETVTWSIIVFVSDTSTVAAIAGAQNMCMLIAATAAVDNATREAAVRKLITVVSLFDR
jgi:hypothetical protein